MELFLEFCNNGNSGNLRKFCIIFIWISYNSILLINRYGNKGIVRILEQW